MEWGSAQPLNPQAPPLPGPVLLRQWWRQLSLIHWRVDPDRVARHLPADVRPDLDDDGATWLGLVPFLLADTGWAGGPAIPYLGTFPETNVRFYSVDRTGRRGVVFASLDAARLLPVLVGRIGFGMPYRWSRMELANDDGVLTYRSSGIGSGPSSIIRVRPLGEPVHDDPVVEFLTARWGFHERQFGRTMFCANRHDPWVLRQAELVELRTNLLATIGFPELSAKAPDSVLFSPGVHTSFTFPRPVPR